MAPEFKITSFSKYEDIPNQYSDDFIKKSKCVKVSEEDNIVFVVCSSDSRGNNDFLNEIHYPKTVKFEYVKDSEFSEFVGNFVEKGNKEKETEKRTERYSLEDINQTAPVVNIINAICLEAVRKNVSDIHIQCEETKVRIRFRVDGVLHTVKELDKSLFPSLVSRIKVMSNLNIMENRLPQDGRMSVVAEGVNYDFRVSVVPVTKGQSIVLRLFNINKSIMHLDELGFSEETLTLLRKSLRLPNGLILMTGPTGAGKTTTLHSMIEEMDKEHLKIISIEDPVERQLQNVDQIQVNESIGLTFESILRRVLRQDPDVIMIGEIRDKATAELAIRASLTGHLILSTLHTNDSVSAVTRLENLGIEPYLIGSVLKLSSAQRLVRKICPICSSKGIAVGCEQCNFTGYKGRTAISECFEVNSEIEKIISERKGDEELRNKLSSENFITLKDDAKRKVSLKETTFEEISREALV